MAACLRSVFETVGSITPQVIVVDNASADKSAAMVRDRYPRVVLIENSVNRGFATANNQGYAVCRGDFILLLNPDTIVRPGAISTALDFMLATPTAGMAACRLLNPDGSLQRSIRRLPSVQGHLLQAAFLDRILLPENRNRMYYLKAPFLIEYPMGAFMMVRRSALRGGMLLDERYFMYAEEKDLAVRLNKNGFSCWFVPNAEIVHVGGQSARQSPVAMFLELQKSQVLFFKEHYSRPKAWALALTWWLVLTIGALSSVLTLAAGRRKRHVLLCRAALEFPQNLRLLMSV